MSDFTHFPILAAAVARTTGPVLELGCGRGSTVMLHYMCDGVRALITLESDLEWLRKFQDYAGGTHQLLWVHPRKWGGCEGIECHNWGVAFVDSAPGEARPDLIRRLKGRAHFIVAHDTEQDSGGNYGYETVFPSFKYVSEFRRFRPYTTVLSDVEPFEIHPADTTFDMDRWLGGA